MSKSVQQVAAEIADREAIRDCLYRYARGIDRREEELIRDCYWPDASDDHLWFSGTRDEFVEFSMASLKSMDQTQHFIGNILINVDGPVASVESYFQAYHRIKADGPARDFVSSGRYLDRFEKRDDVWKIVDRKLVIDWFREYPDSADWGKHIMGRRLEPGGHHPDDVSYGIFKGAS